MNDSFDDLDKQNSLLDMGADDSELNESYIDEYDLTSVPNDFNIITIDNFINSGAILIPGFQRNFVWDIKKSSKLIESLLLGLPVPQLFLYEEDRNKFLVIDGQQRLMSIFYFLRKRFPRNEKRGEIRRIILSGGKVDDALLDNDEYFQPFKLVLPKLKNGQDNKFNGLSYAMLGDYKTQLDLRPIRNIIIKQNNPKNDNSCVYEIFNRLNSGGVNLTPQEIRMCLYHSRFFDMLQIINYNNSWRDLLRSPNADLHMRDIEVLLRSFALAVEYKKYKSSLAIFLNFFSGKAQSFSSEAIDGLKSDFEDFLKLIDGVDKDLFINSGSKRFNIFIFEGLFALYFNNKSKADKINQNLIKSVLSDKDFSDACIAGTTNTNNVLKRLERLEFYLNSDIS